MNQAKVGKFIAQLRKEKKLTQSELAEKLCITDKAVSKWECGLGCPDISLLIPLSEILGKSIYELLIGESLNKVEVEKVDEALKTTIDEVSKEKHKNNIYKVILGIAIIIIIIEIVFIGLFYIDQYKRKNEYRTPLPQNMNLNIVNNYLEEIEKYSCEIDLQNVMCDNGNYYFNTVTYLAMELPMHRFKNEMNFCPSLNPEQAISYFASTISKSQLMYNYELHTEEEINNDLKDNNYTKKSIIVNSIILFNYVKNLDSIKYIFKETKYIINKTDIERIYEDQNINISDLKKQANWEKYVIKNLNDKEYINLILQNFTE